MKKNNSYKKMWLLLIGMIASALIGSLAFTSLIYSVSSQLASVLIMGGALISLVVWMVLAVITLERSYEPGRPTNFATTNSKRDLNPSIARS
jgi:heme/copper-type cytochrome/quinol oxidase subunit 4